MSVCKIIIIIMKTYYAPVSIKKDAHGAATQQCKSILETIMIQLDNDGKINTILYALHHTCIRVANTSKNKSTCKII